MSEPLSSSEIAAKAKAAMDESGLSAQIAEQNIEIERATLNPIEFPTEGEWKRALADRKVFEEAYVVKLSEIESPEPGGQFSLSHPLRGQRFVAVPAGAIGVGFIWEIGGTKQ